MEETVGGQSGQSAAYEAPRLVMHGSLAETTQAFLIGIFVDNNHSVGRLIIGNTSL